MCIWPSSDPIKKSVGDSVTIKCTYFIRDRQLGNGRFRWSGPAVDDSNSGRVEITDKPQFGKSTLKIHKAKASDNGNYTCLYEETGESASKAVTVRGNYGLWINRKGMDKDAWGWYSNLLYLEFFHAHAI